MPRAKASKKKVDKDITDEIVQVFLNREQRFPETIKLLKEKPHLAPSKRHEIENALEEVNVFIENLKKEYVTDNENEKKEEIFLILSSILSLVKTVLELDASFVELLFKKTESVVEALSSLLQSNLINTKFKYQIAVFCEKFALDYPEVVSLKIVTVLLHFLLDLTLLDSQGEKNVKKADIKRIWSLRKLIEKLDILDPANEVLYIRFLSTSNNPNYYKCKEGQNIIGHLMSRSVNFVEKIHATIIKTIPTISKQHSSGYGSVYFTAWSHAEAEVQKAIENCIQDIIIKVVNISRCGFEMPKPGINALSALSSLNFSRRQRKFSDVLNKLYSPILWRGIKSPNPWERCNAAEVFFDIFPLEKPFQSINANSEYMNQQMQAIKDLLHDDSHFVRVIAIKGLCSNMTNSIDLFPINYTRDFLRILLQELILDGSSFHVRKAVYEGIEMMLLGPNGCKDDVIHSVQILRPVISNIRVGFYEDNEKVRKAYFKTLLMVKKREKMLNMKYDSPDMHTMADYLLQLSIEGPIVGEYISKLIMDDIILQNSTMDIQITNICNLMNHSFTGLKNAFQYSKSVLTETQAYYRIVTYVGFVRRLLKKYLDCCKEEQKRKEDNRSMDCDSSTSSNSTTTSTANSTTASISFKNNPEFDLLKKPKYVGGLIQIATVIWVVFRNKFHDNTDHLDNLYSLACSCIPMLLKNYKGTLVYYSTVLFASLIPIAKLVPVSTVSSACISELKEMSDETEEEKLQSLTYSLCTWNRGNDILELVSEWLNYAFKEQNLNNTAMNKNQGEKLTRVRFQQNEGKPLLALKLLDVLFQNSINESKLLEKFYPQLHEFYTFLERILVLLEHRFSADNKFADRVNTNLTDEFLYLTFSRYLKMMHTLHRPSPNNNNNTEINERLHFDAALTSFNVMNWSTIVLYPHLPVQEVSNVDDPPLAVKCCLAVIREATLSVALGETTKEHCHGLCIFTQDLLSLDASTWFIEDVLKTIQTVSEYAQYYTPDDEWQLMSLILPCLLEKVLGVLAHFDTTPNLTKAIFKNNNEVKQALFSLPKLLYQQFGKDNRIFIDCYRNFVFVCILLLIQEIEFEEEVIAHSKLDEVHWLVAMILKHILVTPYFVNQLIPSILKYADTFSQDGMKILSCVSVLHIVAVTASKKFAKNELETAVQRIYALLLNNKLKEMRNNENNETDSFAASNSDAQIDPFKAGEPILVKLSSYLNCALACTNNSSTRDISRIDKTQQRTTDVDNSEVTPSQSAAAVEENSVHASRRSIAAEEAMIEE